MGMYTEIYARGTLVKDTPDQVVAMLQHMVGEDHDPVIMPEHELFKTERWSLLGRGASAYFPATSSTVYKDSYSNNWAFMLHANLKNYGNEIAKFFDWIEPYVEGSEGDFMGYSLYEETEPGQAPFCYFKQVDTW